MWCRARICRGISSAKEKRLLIQRIAVCLEAATDRGAWAEGAEVFELQVDFDKYFETTPRPHDAPTGDAMIEMTMHAAPTGRPETGSTEEAIADSSNPLHGEDELPHADDDIAAPLECIKGSYVILFLVH